MQMQKITQLFPDVPWATNTAMEIPTYESGPHTPQKDDTYVFEKSRLKIVLMWLMGVGGHNLWISGPTGCGKSSLIEQVAARTGQAVYRVACHGRTEMSDLVGTMQIQEDGAMKFVYGPLIRAMIEGALLVLDEGDSLHPTVALGLNGVLDGAPYLIEATGTLVKAHSFFRICITGNSCGMGEAVEYRGTQRQNLAYLDRFKRLKVSYLTPLEESQILNKKFPSLAAIKDENGNLVGHKWIEAIVQTAKSIRDGFLAQNGAGKLNVTLSTRRVCAWAESTRAFGNLEEALACELTNGVPDIEANTIMAILRQHWRP